MENVSIYCPHCLRHTVLSVATGKIHNVNGDVVDPNQIGGYRPVCEWSNGGETWWIGVCAGCNKPSLVYKRGVKVYPTPLPSPTDKRIPSAIGDVFTEAKICFSVDAYRASAAMSRRALQMACEDKGASANDKLQKQIETLATNGVITKDLKEWAHTIRWVGNDGAHPNPMDVDKDDAEETLHLTEQFLHVIYVTPEIAREQLSKRGKTVT
jgi:hypothetical protein